MGLRKYSIFDSSNKLVGVVEAANAPSALRWFARDQFSVALATVDDGFEAASRGLEIQRATTETEDA